MKMSLGSAFGPARAERDEMRIRAGRRTIADRGDSFGGLLTLVGYAWAVILMLGLAACGNSVEFEVGRAASYRDAYNRQYPISFKEAASTAYKDAERAAYAETRAYLISVGTFHRNTWISVGTSASALLLAYIFAHVTFLVARRKGLLDDLTGRLRPFEIQNIWARGQQP